MATSGSTQPSVVVNQYDLICQVHAQHADSLEQKLSPLLSDATNRKVVVRLQEKSIRVLGTWADWLQSFVQDKTGSPSDIGDAIQRVAELAERKASCESRYHGYQQECLSPLNPASASETRGSDLSHRLRSRSFRSGSSSSSRLAKAKLLELHAKEAQFEAKFSQFEAEFFMKKAELERAKEQVIMETRSGGSSRTRSHTSNISLMSEYSSPVKPMAILVRNYTVSLSASAPVVVSPERPVTMPTATQPEVCGAAGTPSSAGSKPVHAPQDPVSVIATPMASFPGTDIDLSPPSWRPILPDLAELPVLPTTCVSTPLGGTVGSTHLSDAPVSHNYQIMYLII